MLPSIIPSVRELVGPSDSFVRVSSRGYHEDFSIELHARRTPGCIRESRDVFMRLNQVGRFNVVSSIFQNVATFRSIHHLTRPAPPLLSCRRFRSRYEMQSTNRSWIKQCSFFFRWRQLNRAIIRDYTFRSTRLIACRTVIHEFGLDWDLNELLYNGRSVVRITTHTACTNYLLTS